MRAWFERDRSRYEQERDFWTSKGFRERCEGDDLSYLGIVELTVSEGSGDPFRAHRFEVSVTYPAGFPHVAPDVKFISPAIRRRRHQSPLGAPCLFPPNAWNSERSPGEFLKALRRWLHSYIVGDFPNELALYELPEYFIPSGLTVVGPARMTDAAEGRASGSFRATEVIGRDLAVVTHIDGNEVGSALLAGMRLSGDVRQTDRVGRWYRLSTPPGAPQRLHELLHILAREGHLLKPPAPQARPTLIALLFQDDVLDEPHWLFLDIGLDRPKKPPHFKNRPVRAADFYMVSQEELFRRIQGIREPDVLAEKSVAVFGAGAIGSVASLALAREGVGSFTLCDPDKLRPGNVMRHALDLADVGQYKAEAMEAAVGRINPFAATVSETTNLREPAVLDRWASSADLILSAIGDDSVESLLNEVIVASEERPPVLFARTLHAGDATRVMLLRPGRDACFTCLMLHRQDDHPDWIEVPASPLAPVHDEGCSAPALPGTGLASAQAGLLLARRAMEVLEAGGGEPNHWFWLERPISAMTATRRPEPGVLRADRFERHPDCSVCRDV